MDEANTIQLGEVCRTVEVPGRTIPGIIHNGPSYFLTSLRVYSDGLIDCWSMVDLAGLRDKIAEGWLVPSVPVEGRLSIHHLGSIEIGPGSQWEQATDDMYDAILRVIRRMNPELSGLFDCHGKDSFALDGSHYTWPPTGRPRYTLPNVQKVVFPGSTKGRATHAITQFSRCHYLVEIAVFADDRTRLYGGPWAVEMPFDELVARIRTTDEFLPPDTGSELRIPGLGNVVLGPGTRLRGRQQLIGELEYCRDQAKNRPTANKRCAAAFERYVGAPTRENFESLRTSYYLTPRHLRKYCGSMDEKDGRIRDVLFGTAGSR